METDIFVEACSPCTCFLHLCVSYQVLTCEDTGAIELYEKCCPKQYSCLVYKHSALYILKDKISNPQVFLFGGHFIYQGEVFQLTITSSRMIRITKYLPIFLILICLLASIPLNNLDARGFILDLFGGMIGRTTTTTTTMETTTEKVGLFGFGK